MDIEFEIERILDDHPIPPANEKRRLKKEIQRQVVDYINGFSSDVLLVATSPYDINEILLKQGPTQYGYVVATETEELGNFLAEHTYSDVLFISFDPDKVWIKYIEKQVKKEQSVYDLYEYLKTKGYSFSREYYETSTHIRDPYADIHDLRKAISSAEETECDELRVQLIFDYVDIRDFRNALLEMDAYIHDKGSFVNEMAALKKDVEHFFEEIVSILNTKDGKSFVMCWVDAIQYDVLEEMPFLKSEKERSLCLENAYTVSPFTIPTYYAIFCKKRPIEDDLPSYKHDVITRDNSELLKYIENKGFVFVRHGDALNIFENENCGYGNMMNDKLETTADIEFIKNLKPYKEMDCREDICPMVLWKSLRDLVMFKRTFTLCHMVLETHTPYICPNYDGEYINSEFNPNERQINAARDYVDQQLHFYVNLWRNKVRTILMSDHGKIEYGKTGRKYADIYHTFVMCHGEGIPIKRYDQMFSYLKFTELINCLDCPEDNSFETLFSEWVQIEDLDKYGVIAMSRLEDESINLEKSSLLGYQAARNLNGMLMRRHDGVFSFYKYPSIMDLYGLGYEQEIEALKNVLPDKKPNLDGDFYKFTRKVYQAIERHEERMGPLQFKADILLDKLMGEIPLGSTIALRGEYAAIRPVLLRFKSDNRIKYVVDNGFFEEQRIENTCFCKEDKLRDYKPNYVIIVSYKFRKAITDSMKRLNLKETSIIDLYEYFEKNGLELKESYRADTISASDILEAIKGE